MKGASTQVCARSFCKLLVLTIFLTGCEVAEIKPPAAPANKYVAEKPRDLLPWYDETQKAYYGVRGPVKSLILLAPTEQKGQELAKQERQLVFSTEGRLEESRLSLNGTKIVSKYTYEARGLSNANTTYDGSLWRVLELHYELNKLKKIVTKDLAQNAIVTILVARQDVNDGWFEILYPVENPDVPAYYRYRRDGALVWGSKGDDNHGLEKLFLLSPIDSVTSSDVLNVDTQMMQEQGGYRYHYDEFNRLRKVESYNGHNFSLYHVTNYEYDDIGLLKSEDKKLVGTSLFNSAVDETVDYTYEVIDEYGNWLSRVATYRSKNTTKFVRQKRKIEYY